MKGMQCNTSNCTHNRNCHCMAGIINIAQNGVCMTRQKREYGILEQNAVNLEAARDFDFDRNEDTVIQCQSTRCKYNRNHVCTGSRVQIADGMFRTRCMTKTVDRS